MTTIIRHRKEPPMTTIIINGTKYPLTFDLGNWQRMEEEIGMVDDLQEKVSGKERVGTIRKALEILSDGAITPEISARLRPATFPDAINAMWQAIYEGMKMETGGEEEEGEVDVVLEEIEKKERPGV